MAKYMTQYMLKILTLLHKENYRTMILAIDRSNIREKLNEKVSNDKLSRSLLYLERNNYIATGVKSGKTKRYYITNIGLDFLNDSFNIKKLKEKGEL